QVDRVVLQRLDRHTPDHALGESRGLLRDQRELHQITTHDRCHTGTPQSERTRSLHRLVRSIMWPPTESSQRVDRQEDQPLPSFGEGLLYRHGERCTIVPDVSWFHTLFTQRRLSAVVSPSSAWVFDRLTLKASG